MKGYTFYLEYPQTKDKRQGTRKNLGNHSGNVLAAYGNWYGTNNGCKKECIGGLMFSPNSVVCGTSVHSDYLRTNCKRIGEAQARTIHPNLFSYLDN